MPEAPRLADQPVIQNLRTSAQIQRPALKDLGSDRYYDPFIILRNLAKRKNKKLSCLDLRAKAATLVCIDGAARVNELTKMFIENFEFGLTEVSIRVYFTKEMQHSDWTIFQFFCSCVSGQEPDLLWRQEACTYCALKAYYEHKTVKARRSKVGKLEYKTPKGTLMGTPFFVTHKNKAGPTSVNSLQADVGKSMRSAGIPSAWKVHSLRGAVTSKLRNLGVEEKRVLQFGRWSNAKTFNTSYFRQCFYKEASSQLSTEPLWKLLRLPVTLMDAVRA